MKAARPLLFGFGAVLLLVLIAVAVVFNSSVQTWAAQRALAAQPDWRGSIGRVSAGWRQVEVRNLRLERQGAVLTLPSAEATLPLWAAGVKNDVQVSRLVAKGWTLDLTNASKLTVVGTDLASLLAPEREPPRATFSLLSTAYAAEPAAEAVFRGVFHELRLPVDLSLDGVDLDGEVILPAHNGAGTVRTRVVLRGGGLAAGREGSFTVDLSAAKGDGSALTLRARVLAGMDTPRTLSRLGTHANATVSGAQIPTGVSLDIDANVTRTPSGESYSLLVARAEKQLARANAELVTATARISGTWGVDLQDTDLAPFALGRSLPSVTAVGEGEFQTDTTLQEVHASGRLKASADQLAVLRPELAAVGRTHITADFDVLQHGGSLRVERFTADFAGAAPVASVRALQPFEFNLSTAELRVADPAQDLVGISLSGVPVAWAQRLFGEFALTGGDVRGEFVASARDGGLALRAKRPLTIAGLSLRSPDGELLRELDVTLNASADYTPRGWQAQVVEFTVRHQSATLLSLDARAGRLNGDDRAIKVAGRWSANLPGWLSQPIVAGQLQLATGAAQGEFSASLDGVKSVEAKLQLLNLSGPAKEPLPSLAAELRADVAVDGAVTFKSPWLFEQAGRKSDLLLAGTVVPGPSATNLDARLTSEMIHVDDVKLLLLLLPPEQRGSPTSTVEETGAPWAAVSGQVTLALEKVNYGGSLEVSDVGGTVRIDPQALRLDAVKAVFGPESDLRLSGGVHYDANAPKAYAFSGDMVLRNLDTSPVFRAVDPAKLPTVEAHVNVNSHLTGSGASLAEVMEQTRGRFEVTSRGGIFRALATVLPADKLQAGSSALSIVGGFFGGSTQETTNAALEIVRILSEISFDQLSLKAERGDSGEVLLSDFTLISPTVRLGGVGKIDYVPGRSLLDQTLDLQITLGARGRLGELLDQVKLLKPEKDNLGYSAFSTPIRIGGTLANTDTSELNAKLINLALERSGVGEAINKILGGGK